MVSCFFGIYFGDKPQNKVPVKEFIHGYFIILKFNCFIPASNEPSGHACMHIHDNKKLAFYCMATAARVKYPAALQRYKFDAPLLAAGSLTFNNICCIMIFTEVPM